MKTKPVNIPIIYYHSVGLLNPGWARNFLTLEKEYFEDQIRYFSRNFRCISLNDFYLIQVGARPPVKDAIVLTFDDGYLDNWQWAFPLLKKYGLQATIFVSPEFVDNRSIVRPNLDDVWSGNASMDDLMQWGFLSWDEMRAMEKSGIVNIESHTMTHTKYAVSDTIKRFHQYTSDSLYTIANLFPERKPQYIQDVSFSSLIPQGYPIFEEKSSVVARKVTINPEFVESCIEYLGDLMLRNSSFEEANEIVRPLYEKFKKSNRLIIHTESEFEYQSRLNYEIINSKAVIEKELNKKVSFLCWPHGDNNSQAHQLAINGGYKATTWGKMDAGNQDAQRIPHRVGGSNFKNNRKLTLLRAKFKVKCAQHRFPFYQIHNLYHKIRY